MKAIIRKPFVASRIIIAIVLSQALLYSVFAYLILESTNAAVEEVGLYPFNDYAVKPIGFIQAELMDIPMDEAMRTVTARLWVLGTAMVAALALTLAFSIRTLLSPLRNVVDQIHVISRRITSFTILSYTHNPNAIPARVERTITSPT